MGVIALAMKSTTHWSRGSFWEGDSLLRGRVTAAEVKRDRYGNLYLEVELEEVTASC